MKQISFLINCSVNTLDHLKLLLKSLKENLSNKEHEILIFVDSDNEGIADWLREQKKDFFDLRIITHKLTPCVGYSRNSNLLVELAKHDIVSYLQADMVISPNYDLDILSDLEDNCILSATRIEPPLHGQSYQTITQDFGTDPNDFKWNEFQTFSVQAKNGREIEYFFAPFTFYKKVWMEVGGYDTMFRRSREDSDLLQRFIQKGVKIKQTFKANVYHFSCVASRGKDWFNKENKEAQTRVQIQQQADQVELVRFVRKWGKFNHGEQKLVKYDMDLTWIDGDIPDLARISPYFSRTWLSSEITEERIKTYYRTDQAFANQLLKFSHPDWEKSKQFYNQVDYNYVYKLGRPEDYNIQVVVNMVRDANDQPPAESSDFISYLPILNDIIAQYEPGMYQLGNATIHVKNKVNLAEKQIVVENPPFDYSLLTIE